MTFGEGSSDLEFVGALVSAVGRLADTPAHYQTHLAAVNTRIYDRIGSAGVKACTPGDPGKCPVAAYLKSAMGEKMVFARVTDLSVGTGAIQVTFAPEYDGYVSRRFVLDTPGILAEFISAYDKANRAPETPDSRPDVLDTLIDGAGRN